MAEKKLRVLDPTSEPVIRAAEMAPRILDLRGKTVGLLENTKSNARALLEEVGGLLRERFGVENVVVARKPTFGRVAPDEVLDALASECQVVITGLGD